MPKIKELLPQVRNMIAAGEVVERPASVVKELIENAVDAHATHITVESQGGGVPYLRVADDGEGMDAADAKTAFLRHATSKLSAAEELFHVETMGFRGEALAATASVSRIDLFTRRHDDAMGTALSLEAGVVTHESEAGCPEGTTILVRDLFFNTPARRKFLKKDMTEAAHILLCVQRAALSRPDIAFTYLRDGKMTLQTSGSGDPAECLYAVFGAEFARGLVPLSGTTHAGITVSGFVSKPENAHKSRQGQHMFVNGRPVSSRTVMAALEQACKNSLMQGRFPACVLTLTLPHNAYDINVHPAKLDIKFINERDVFDAVYFAVRGTLEGLERPVWRDRSEQPPVVSTGDNKGSAFVRMPAEEFRKQINAPGASLGRETPRATSAGESVRPGRVSDGETLYRVASGAEETKRGWTPLVSSELSGQTDLSVKSPERIWPSVPTGNALPPIPQPTEQEPPVERLADPVDPIPERVAWRTIGSALGGYLLVEIGESLVLIDQHAAHERILFNRLSEERNAPMAQTLLAPVTVTPPTLDLAVLLEQAELLRGVGFELDAFGGQTLIVRAAPSGIAAEDIPALLSELAESLRMGVRQGINVREGLLDTIACKAAVKLHDRLNPAETEALVARVMTDNSLRHCPHGRPVSITLTRGQIEKQFKRS